MPLSTSDRDALFAAISVLTPELASLIVDHCIGNPTLALTEYGTHPLINPHYNPEIEPSSLPKLFQAEAERLLHQKWLRSRKTFHQVTDFVFIHLACLMHRGAFNIVPEAQSYARQLETITLPLCMQPSSKLNLTGLEDIKLELPTDIYFSIFGVGVPPFPTTDHRFHDESMLGAGTYLAHTRHLALVFTASDPWDMLWMPWIEEDVDNVPAHERPSPCTSGLIIDWILTYAWHNAYLQHIPRITLAGDIQPWIRDKWSQVFAGTHPEQDQIGSESQLYHIEHHGQWETLMAGGIWVPEEHYPPKCTCKVSCRGLGEVSLGPEWGKSSGWDEHGDVGPAEEQAWFGDAVWDREGW